MVMKMPGQIDILSAIGRHYWAMTEASFSAMINIAERNGLSAKDYEIFHALKKEQRESFLAFFGTREKGKLYTYRKGNVGYLLVDGPIIPRAQMFSNISGIVSIDSLQREFSNLENDESITDIVHVMDSPGGNVQLIQDYAATIARSTKKTHTFALQAASAAYWIGAASNNFVVSSTGMVGSIGTVVTIVDRRKQEEREGVEVIEIVSSQSPNKRADPKTEEGHAQYQQLVDDLAAVFIADVAQFRNVSEDHVLKNFGGGAMFSAKRALSAGMVDSISGAHEFAASIEKGKYMAKQANDGAAATTDAVAEAIKTERERGQKIEGLAARFKDHMPAVADAAQAAASACKADGSSVEAAAMKILEAVASATPQAALAFEQPRRDAAQSAAFIQQEGDDKDAEATASENRVNKLISARDRFEGVSNE